jgi:hypothetical protein
MSDSRGSRRCGAVSRGSRFCDGSARSCIFPGRSVERRGAFVQRVGGAVCPKPRPEVRERIMSLLASVIATWRRYSGSGLVPKGFFPTPPSSFTRRDAFRATWTLRTSRLPGSTSSTIPDVSGSMHLEFSAQFPGRSTIASFTGCGSARTAERCRRGMATLSGWAFPLSAAFLWVKPPQGMSALSE